MIPARVAGVPNPFFSVSLSKSSLPAFPWRRAAYLLYKGFGGEVKCREISGETCGAPDFLKPSEGKRKVRFFFHFIDFTAFLRKSASIIFHPLESTVFPLQEKVSSAHLAVITVSSYIWTGAVEHNSRIAICSKILASGSGSVEKSAV